MRSIAITLVVGCLTALAGCGGGDDVAPRDGAAGRDGAQGPAGKDGAPGAQGPAGKDVAVSGTRIKARYLLGDDGARMLLGWQDTKLGAACEWGVASDSKTRCLPGSDEAPSTLRAYMSENCAGPVVAVSVPGNACPESSGYVRHVEPASCPWRRSVFSVGAPYAGTMPISMSVYTGATCAAFAMPSAGLRASVETQPEDMIEATETTD